MHSDRTRLSVGMVEYCCVKWFEKAPWVPNGAYEKYWLLVQLRRPYSYSKLSRAWCDVKQWGGLDVVRELPRTLLYRTTALVRTATISSVAPTRVVRALTWAVLATYSYLLGTLAVGASRYAGVAGGAASSQNSLNWGVVCRAAVP